MYFLMQKLSHLLISGYISPADTEWAEGTTNDLNNLVFTDFKNAAPKNMNGSPKS